MKATVEYVTKVIKEVEIPDSWVDWAEAGWEDEKPYEEIEKFWAELAKEDENFMYPVGLYYGDHGQWMITEY